MTKNNDLALEVKDFTFSYGGDSDVIKGITFDIKKNKVTAIIGPSGCGKSTFLRSINRLHDLVPTARYGGEILFDGKNIFDKSSDVSLIRKKIGMVFQKPNPFPKSIYENLIYAPKIHGESDKDVLEKIVEESLKSVALWDEVKDKLHDSALSLSGGQQQRLCIARAISITPEILLMDEPTASLDPISTSRIEELTRELVKKFTIVIVTHNMQQASRISDDTAFFYQGYLEEFDKTEIIFTTPKKKRTEDYISWKFG